MDRSALVDAVARTRQAAAQCERLIAAQSERIRSLRASGHSTAELEAALSDLDAEYSRHMAEMERILDQLDGLEAAQNAGGTQA